MQFWFMITYKGRGYLGIWYYWFLQEQNVCTLSSSGTPGPREHEELLWDFYKKQGMFLRFTVVWLPCSKISEACWSYVTGLENSCIKTVWLRGNFLFCLSGCVFKLNSPSVDSSTAFHRKHVFSERVSWSYRFKKKTQQAKTQNFLTSFTKCCVAWPDIVFMFVGDPSFHCINGVSVIAYYAVFWAQRKRKC